MPSFMFLENKVAQLVIEIFFKFPDISKYPAGRFMEIFFHIVLNICAGEMRNSSDKS